MAGWEIALIIVAATYLMVNTVSVLITLKMMVKMDGYLTKGAKLLEKLMDYGEKSMDNLFEDLNDEES